jgi:hypothetical protein
LHHALYNTKDDCTKAVVSFVPPCASLVNFKRRAVCIFADVDDYDSLFGTPQQIRRQIFEKHLKLLPPILSLHTFHTYISHISNLDVLQFGLIEAGCL